jgi:hypothetical protein
MVIRLTILLSMVLVIPGAAAQSTLLNAKGVSGKSDCISKDGRWSETPPTRQTNCVFLSEADCARAGAFSYDWQRSGERVCDFDAGQERKKCLAEGNTWTFFGLLQTPGCLRKATDAGKICRDANDCQFHRCIYKGPELPFGSAASGVCAETNDGFGCATHVRDGKAQGWLCVD